MSSEALQVYNANIGYNHEAAVEAVYRAGQESVFLPAPSAPAAPAAPVVDDTPVNFPEAGASV